jgi:hypothetical protein
MDRNHFAQCTGDAINAVLAAVVCNFRLPLRWLASLCSWITARFAATPSRSSQPRPV